MEKILEFTFEVVKVVFDLSFTLNMIPLKRSNKTDLRLESTVRSSTVKYTVWFLQAVFYLQKLIFLLFRGVTSETYAYLILHINMLLQLVTGLLCTASFVTKSEEARNYFNLLPLHSTNLESE